MSGRAYFECCKMSDQNTTAQCFTERMVVRVCGRDLYSGSLGINEIIQILKTIPLKAAIIELSSAGILLANSIPSDGTTEKLTQHFLDDYQLKKFRSFERRHEGKMVLMSEQGVMVLLQMARIYCERNADPGSIGMYRAKMGRAMLIVNDLLARIDDYGQLPNIAARLSILRGLTPFLMRQSIFMDSDQPRYSIPRSVLIFSKMNKIVANTFSVDDVIRNACGFDLKTFLEAAFIVNGYWLTQTYDKWAPQQVIINPSTVFSLMGNSASRYSKALDYFTQDTVADAPTLPLEEDVDGWRRFVYGAYDLRKRPLLRLDDGVYCGSLKFTQDLYWHAPYYLVIDNSIDTEKDRFFQFCGDSFEEYIFALTRDAFGENCSRIELASGTPFNDGVIKITDDWLLIIETKAAKPTRNMASGNTPFLDMSEFENKIHYGAQQLADRITEYRRETGYNGRISPCLLTMGSMPLNSMLWELINDGIRDTGLAADLRNDLLLISDPVGWEVFCSLVRAGDSAADILNQRLTQTNWKTDKFKDFLYCVPCQSSEPPHEGLLSLHEDIVEDICKTFNRGTYKRRSIGDEWRQIFPTLS